MTRPRLRLRAFIVLIAGVSVAAWYYTHQPKRRSRAIAATQRLGGVFQLDQEYRPEWKPRPPPRIDWTKSADKWLGPGFAHDLSVVNLDGRPVSDDSLADLAGIKSLRRLYLNATPITGKGLIHLQGSPQLEILELRETRISDAEPMPGLDLPSLRVLYLSDTRVGDLTLASLARLERLEELRLGHTSVSDAGLAHLAGLRKLKAQAQLDCASPMRALYTLRALERDPIPRLFEYRGVGSGIAEALSTERASIGLSEWD